MKSVRNDNFSSSCHKALRSALTLCTQPDCSTVYLTVVTTADYIIATVIQYIYRGVISFHTVLQVTASYRLVKELLSRAA